jgi:hypothetical protein
MPEPKQIEEIVGDLGDTYFIREDAEKLQKTLRSEFFDAATLSQEDASLATKTWIAPKGVSDPEGLATKYNPGWLIANRQDGEENHLLLVEDPDFKEVTVTSEGDNGRYTITKQIRSGSDLIDDDRMIEEDPDLWDQVSYYPALDFLRQWVPEEDLERAAIGIGLSRQLKNPDDLTPEEIESIKPYAYEGKKVKALIVKLAKDEE